ncbi:MAG: Fic/DOC family protein [Proteobacteria bacterium]|nr:MAG: Fic/DOC family protein [Pseudomonadota bacterium]
MNNKELVLFTLPDGNVTIDVQLNNENVWLSLNQLSTLFDRDKSVISRHLKNIFLENELDKNSVVAIFATTASDGKRYQVEYYNLDAILSVGYRVNSKQATKFRQWANKVLKDYILKGYALNNNILDTTHKEYQQLLDLLNNTLISNQQVTAQGQNILALINDYATTWSALLQYDEDRLAIPNTIHKNSLSLDYVTSISAITEFKNSLLAIGEATALFANERNEQLQSILANLDQTMFGEELYQSVEEKAANLLYMVIKDHPFSDGNKRIGSFLFVLYLQLNKLTTNVNNIGLTSLALLVAESDPAQKDLIIRLIINLLVK